AHARRRHRHRAARQVHQRREPDEQRSPRVPGVHRLLDAHRHAERAGGREQVSAEVLRVAAGARVAVALDPAARAPPPNDAPPIPIRGLAKRFGEAGVYDRFDLDLARGKFTSVFGPNGCGKSTLTNMIAGLVPADAGEILFGGKHLAETKIGYVFQNYREALFPWLRSIDNIEYPLKLAQLAKPERRAKVDRLVVHLCL